MNKYVQVEGVQVVFETKNGSFVAIQDINLSVQQGEFISIIGHSGCGKSTLLRIIGALGFSRGRSQP